MTIKVDLAELTEAFEDATPALNYYVDRVTGEVILVSETLGFIESRMQREEMALQPGRHLAVPTSGAGDLIDDLESFIDQLDDQSAQAALEDALESADVAAALPRALAKRDEVARMWSDHRRARFRARAAAWLTEHGFGAA